MPSVKSCPLLIRQQSRLLHQDPSLDTKALSI